MLCTSSCSVTSSAVPCRRTPSPSVARSPRECSTRRSARRRRDRAHADCIDHGRPVRAASSSVRRTRNRSSSWTSAVPDRRARSPRRRKARAADAAPPSSAARSSLDSQGEAAARPAMRCAARSDASCAASAVCPRTAGHVAHDHLSSRSRRAHRHRGVARTPRTSSCHAVEARGTRARTRSAARGQSGRTAAPSASSHVCTTDSIIPSSRCVVLPRWRDAAVACSVLPQGSHIDVSQLPIEAEGSRSTEFSAIARNALEGSISRAAQPCIHPFAPASLAPTTTPPA